MRRNNIHRNIQHLFGKDERAKGYIAEGQIHYVLKLLGVDAAVLQQTQDEAIAQQNVNDYGTAKSGNWGHKGRPGKHGGSAKGTGSKAYRGQGKQYNTGQMSAQKYYGNRKEWANGLKGDKGHRADTLITQYAKQFDEALASGKLVMKKANTKKFDTPEDEAKYLATLEPWQVKEYKKNNSIPDPKKMTPTQKAAYAVSFAEKGAAGATNFREKAQFVELMGEAKHWKQYKDKYIAENLTEQQAAAMKAIEDAYGGDEQLITGTFYEGKFYPGEAPKGVAKAYTALKCKAMTERTTPINYHYQGGSDVLGVIDPTKAAKSIQGMSDDKMQKMNALLEPAIKTLGTDSDGYPLAYKLTKMSSPGMVDKSQSALLNAADAKDVPLKNVRKYLQMKGEGTSYQADVKSVMDAIAAGQDIIKSKNPLAMRMRKLDKQNGVAALTALANIVKKYDNGKFATDVNAFEEHLAYKATPQEQMAYLRAKAAILSDKQSGTSSLYGYGDQKDKAYDFSKYNGGDWESWHGQGVPVPNQSQPSSKSDQGNNGETDNQSQKGSTTPTQNSGKNGDLVPIGTNKASDKGATSHLQGKTIKNNYGKGYSNCTSSKQKKANIIAGWPTDVYDHFRDDKQYDDWIMGLDDSQKHGIKTYKNSGGCHTMQDPLAGKEEMTNTARKAIRGMDAAMDAYELKEDTVIWSGVNIVHILDSFMSQHPEYQAYMALPQWKRNSKDFINPVDLIGRTWHNPCYMSGSPCQYKAWDKDSLVSVVVPKGKGVGCFTDLLTEKTGQYADFQHECQWLMARDIDYTINDVRYQDTGDGPKWHFYVTACPRTGDKKQKV